jgi:hypothetical protein
MKLKSCIIGLLLACPYAYATTDSAVTWEYTEDNGVQTAQYDRFGIICSDDIETIMLSLSLDKDIPIDLSKYHSRSILPGHITFSFDDKEEVTFVGPMLMTLGGQIGLVLFNTRHGEKPIKEVVKHMSSHKNMNVMLYQDDVAITYDVDLSGFKRTDKIMTCLK